MTLNVNVGGTWKNVPAVSVKVAGVWKAGLAAYVNVAGVWKQFWAALTVDYPPITQTNSGSGSSGFVSIGAGTPTITNGSGSYTWSWVRLSGDTPSISNAAVQSPVFSATVFNATPNVSTWRVTCTDTVTGAVATSDEGVVLNWIQTG